MNYFVTGGSGFIGRHLVEKLLARGGAVYVLVREQSSAELDRLRELWGVDDDRVVAVGGDLSKPNLGVADTDIARLRGRIDHLFHLAALYDMSASDKSLEMANVQGTRHAVQLSETLRVKRFHHVSSIAAAGLYKGVFLEDMFEEATRLEHPYLRTKHHAEAVVRAECRRPWRIYRPGMVVGHSKTGEMDKVDGPYYLFKLIQTIGSVLPSWLPMVGVRGGSWNIVPVDFVVDAMVHIAHEPDQDARCFHLTDPRAKRFGEVLAIFLEAARKTRSTRSMSGVCWWLPISLAKALGKLPPIRRTAYKLLEEFGIVPSLLPFIEYPTQFDSRHTEALLEGTDIKVPPLENFAEKLWDYWEHHLDPDSDAERSLAGTVRDRVVMVTGASSGIGKATALTLGEAGAKVLLVARRTERLLEVREAIERLGGDAHIYTCDISDMTACDALIEKVQDDHGAVDILINNAGRSIRRSLALSFNRFHDFERTMKLNYFASLRLTLGFLPDMVKRRRGHVINISSIGVLANPPRFSAYVASKAALDAFARCAAPELSGQGIHFTTINMPIVSTSMIEPTPFYKYAPAISQEKAADMIARAIIRKPKRVATPLGIVLEVASIMAPNVVGAIMSTAFRLFPDSAAAKGANANATIASPGPLVVTDGPAGPAERAEGRSPARVRVS